MNETFFKLIGIEDTDENALFSCSFCGNIIPIELDENGAIVLPDIGETCPECDAVIRRIDLE